VEARPFATPARTITEADVVSFAGRSGDFNPLHVNWVFAAVTDFGGRIAHGPMTIGVAFGLASRLDLLEGTVMALLAVHWDFKAPVRLGDTLHAIIEVARKRPTHKPRSRHRRTGAPFYQSAREHRADRKLPGVGAPPHPVGELT
jgi:acyl dehydratase